MPTRARFTLATSNPAKVHALAEYLPDWIEIAPLPKNAPDPPDLETGESFAEIARDKAVWWSHQLPDILVIATDGGLLIPALGSLWNPLKTARFLGPTTSSRERIAAIIQLAGVLEGADREIGWAESLAIARNGRLLAEWNADSPPGILATSTPDTAPLGGFWVPQIWLCPEFEQSSARQSVRIRSDMTAKITGGNSRKN